MFIYTVNTERAEGWYAIKDLKKGELIKLKPESKSVYVRGTYIQSERKYELENYNDINKCSYKKGETLVWAGFTY